MTYNLSAIADNATTLIGFTRGVNDVLMGGWLGTMMLISIAVVLFTSYLSVSGDASKSLTATAFICSILAILLRALVLINDTTLFATLILGGLTLAMTIVMNKSN